MAGQRVEPGGGVQAQLAGLLLLRDIARLPQLREADAETIAYYLGPALQQLLRPGRDHRADT